MLSFAAEMPSQTIHHHAFFMKIIIPMAGRGTRLRPHTLSVPKPLVPVAGKTIIEHLVDLLAKSYGGPIAEIAFITGDFGKEVEADLLEIAAKKGAKGRIFYQKQALGIAHAIQQAADCLHGKCIVAFADTLFKAEFQFDQNEDGIIWTNAVENPSSFGVVKLDEAGFITDFVEKPAVFVSNQAIVGIYYFREAEKLRAAIDHIIQNNVREKNEFQLTTCLEKLKTDGLKFRTASVEEWLDCGNKEAVLHSNARMLALNHAAGHNLISEKAVLENTVVIAPAFIGAGARVKNSVVGPHASIGEGAVVENSVISDSIVQQKARVKNAVLDSTMIGQHSTYIASKTELNVGDFCDFKN